jgi:hypothetical protein
MMVKEHFKMKSPNYKEIMNNVMARDTQASPQRKGRINKLFKQRTPHLGDSEIKDMLKKYPVAKVDESDPLPGLDDKEALELQAQQRN